MYVHWNSARQFFILKEGCCTLDVRYNPQFLFDVGSEKKLGIIIFNYLICSKDGGVKWYEKLLV